MRLWPWGCGSPPERQGVKARGRHAVPELLMLATIRAALGEPPNDVRGAPLSRRTAILVAKTLQELEHDG